MTPPKLVKDRWPPQGSYRTTGNIEELAEGRREIRSLRIRSAVGSIKSLAMLRHLESLVIDGGRELDLSELAALSTTCHSVALSALQDTDLGGLMLPETVRSFGLSSPHKTCPTSRTPGLPRGLDDLGLTARAGSSGISLRRFIDAIQWDDLDRLERLDLHAEARAAGYPVEIDFGLFRSLPRLERSDVFGFRHRRSAGPSPLEPPFDGLPEKLSWLRIDAELPVEELKPAIETYLGRHVSVEQLYLPRESDQLWWINQSDDGQRYLAIGSLADHFTEKHFAEEAQALRHARTRIKIADPALLKRLDFDQDSDSTMIVAQTRRDMLATLTALQIEAPNAGEGKEYA